MEITQTEAEYLMKLVKQFETKDTIVLGNTYLKKIHPLISMDGREKFSLDIWHSSFILNKYRFQERARSVIILARVDIGGALHTNPDGVKVLCPHIHLYREGYGDKWAYPLEDYKFQNSNDIVTTFIDFARFCNIVDLPKIQRSLV